MRRIILIAVGGLLVALIAAYVVVFGVIWPKSDLAHATELCRTFAEKVGAISVEWHVFLPSWDCSWHNPDDTGGGTKIYWYE